MPRTRIIFRQLAAIAIGMSASIAIAADPVADKLSPRLDGAVQRGVAFLAKQQRPDGAIPVGGPATAMTALSLMAFLSAGQTPRAGSNSAAVRLAVDYLLKKAPPNGYFGSTDGSRMYGHAIVTLALCEAYGVEPDRDKREQMLDVLRRAVAVVLKAQDIKKDPVHAGGWRYEPTSGDSDLSLSGWAALSLRACAGVGIDVPKDRAARAVAYVLKCYRADDHAFCYQPGANPSLPMTGVGVLDLFLLGAGDRPEAMAAAQTLTKSFVKPTTRFPYYAYYYTTQAAYQVGDATWQTVWKANQDGLLDTQQPDGGWPQSTTGEEPGRVYATAMSVLSLTVPYRLLPIYQR